MLVRLTSSTSGEMIMLAEHARVLFGWIDKECTARGVFTKEQLPEAIAGLRRGVEEEKQQEKQAARRAAEEKAAAADEETDDQDDKEKEKKAEVVVTLGQRAQPLIHLMEWTLKEGGFILWEAKKSF